MYLFWGTEYEVIQGKVLSTEPLKADVRILFRQVTSQDRNLDEVRNAKRKIRRKNCLHQL